MARDRSGFDARIGNNLERKHPGWEDRDGQQRLGGAWESPWGGIRSRSDHIDRRCLSIADQHYGASVRRDDQRSEPGRTESMSISTRSKTGSLLSLFLVIILAGCGGTDTNPRNPAG